MADAPHTDSWPLPHGFTSATLNVPISSFPSYFSASAACCPTACQVHQEHLRPECYFIPQCYFIADYFVNYCYQKINRIFCSFGLPFLNRWPPLIYWFNLILCIKQSRAHFVFATLKSSPSSKHVHTQAQIRSSLPLSHISEARALKGFRQLLLSSEGRREGRRGGERREEADRDPS